MRPILALLLSIILLQSQVFASSGGPDYNRLDNSYYIRGTYSGVLRSFRQQTTAPAKDINYVGSVGTFTSTFANSTEGTGKYYIFNKGVVANGNLTLVANGNKKTMFGILRDDATGSMELKLTEPSRNVNARYESFKGTATVNLLANPNETTYYRVDGYHATLPAPQ